MNIRSIGEKKVECGMVDNFLLTGLLIFLLIVTVKLVTQVFFELASNTKLNFNFTIT